MRWFSVFGAVFCFFITTIAVKQAVVSLYILDHGSIVRAELVKKPSQFYVRKKSRKWGSCVFRYNGNEITVELAKERIDSYSIGDARPFYYSTKYPDELLNIWEAREGNYWDFACGVLFFLLGCATLYREFIYQPRKEKREAEALAKELILPNGKRRRKAKYSHLTLKKAKQKGDS